MREIKLFGCPINAVKMEEALRIIEGYIDGGTPRQAVFLNAGKLVEMDTNAELADSVKKADLRLADGQAVVWASRFLGRPLPERVAGVDLMQKLMEEGAKKGRRFFFLGARQEVLEKAVEKSRKRFKDIAISGSRNGYFSREEEGSVVDEIRRASPDILFVGISSPKKEEFVERNLMSMNVPFTMGVGGSFDIVAGKRSRAPAVVQRVGMEWLYRLLQEPSRMWRRYLVGNPIFIWKVAKCRLGICKCCR
ncbi:MAG: WecB/TagA/CpsF family glycosyltransferase [Nitrospinota bacterium]